MPKVELVKDGPNYPLRITRRKGRQNAKSEVPPSFRIRCGCGCTEALTVTHGDPDSRDPLIEIDGVAGTIKQWQKALGPVLEMVPK